MAESTKGDTQADKNYSHHRDTLLVLGIDREGNIIQFNDACEHIVGYTYKETVDKSVERVIPQGYVRQWQQMIDAARLDPSIREFKLPLLTNEGKEVMISWSSFPVKEDTNHVEDVVFVGKRVLTVEDVTDSLFSYTKNDIETKVDAIACQQMPQDHILLRMGDKHLIFRRHPEKSFKPETEHPSLAATPMQKEEQPVSTSQAHDLETVVAHETYSRLMEQYNYENLLKNYNEIAQTLSELERRNKELEKINKKTMQTLKSMKTRWAHKKEAGKREPSTRSPLLGRGKRESLERMMQELEERKNELLSFGEQIAADKKQLTDQQNIFIEWRKKLELLEDEIENRRLDLIEQQHSSDNRLSSSLQGNITESGDINSMQELYHDMLDKIPECAAIVHRGVLKQVNTPLAQLLGYEIEELVDKSFLDFIVPEGLFEVEKYYFNRLKKENVSSYETILLTKDNQKMPVEVNVKPVVYDGEGADVTIIRVLTTMNQQG